MQRLILHKDKHLKREATFYATGVMRITEVFTAANGDNISTNEIILYPDEIELLKKGLGC